MSRRMILMLTLAAIAAVVLTAGAGGVSVAASKPIECVSGKVCKGTEGPDWIFGSAKNDNIRPMGGDDYVFANSGDDQVAHSSGDDRIFGGCGSDTVRGGFGFDRIYANVPVNWSNMPLSWYPEGGISCASVTKDLNLSSAQITALGEPVGDEQLDSDEDDRAHDLVDCAYLESRGNTGADEGFGQPTNAVVPDTVVDCSNRDDQ